MKQTAEQMVAAIQAFEKDGKVEWSSDGKKWEVTTAPSWNFDVVMYRPVKVLQVVKYLCYESVNGGLYWVKQGTQDQKHYENFGTYTRVPELDKEVTR